MTTTTRRKYQLTDAHRAQLGPWADRWIRNAMNTESMTDEDRRLCIDAVERMYRAAKLTPPPAHRIVFVPSPFVARFAGGFAAWIWYCRNNRRAATDDATNAATYAATDAATYAATDDATRAATNDATNDATYDARRFDNWFLVNGDMKQCAFDIGVGMGGLHCAQMSCRMWQGGNQWSSLDSFISFFRHVAQLDIDYSAWDAWETLSLHSGPRIVHQDFCIISDRPERLLVDDQNRPHCDDGPFCRWRDGSGLYAVHGVRVPAWLMERRDQLTAKRIDAQDNAEIRRVMIELYGWQRYLTEVNARVIDSRINEIEQTREYLMRAKDMTVLLCHCPSTARVYALEVDPRVETCEQAQGWLWNANESRYGAARIIGRS